MSALTDDLDALGIEYRVEKDGAVAMDCPVHEGKVVRQHADGRVYCTGVRGHYRADCLDRMRRPDTFEDDDDEKPWGRLDLRNIPKPTPPTVGRICEGVYAFTRGRRYNVYGKSETGKSRFCYCLAVREALDGRVAVILNGEMADEDVLDWLLTSGEEELSHEAWDEVLDRVLIYPSSGLLTERQRKQIISDIDGRDLSLVIADSSTSLLSEAGLNPNAAEEIERMYRDLGLWFTRQVTHPAFVVIDHVSKGSDGSSSETGSIRKRNVVDMSLHVENAETFSPETVYGPAKSGYSTVKIAKGRRGGKGLEVARVLGHNNRVWVDAPSRGIPWSKARDYEPRDKERRICTKMAALIRETGEKEVAHSVLLDALGGNRTSESKVLQEVRDSSSTTTEFSFLTYRKGKRGSIYYSLTKRGWETAEAG